MSVLSASSGGSAGSGAGMDGVAKEKLCARVDLEWIG